MKATSRRVFVFNMDVVTARKDAVLPTMQDLVAVWERRWRAGQCHVDIGAGDIVVTLGDMKVDLAVNTVSLLFRHSDKGAAESVYSDIDQTRDH